MWIEEFRPRSLQDVLGQEPIIERLQAFAKEPGKMPNFLFAGPAGVGKTSTAIALAREIFQDTFFENYKELNASDDRGIRMVREEIKNYASIRPHGDMPFRLLVLDEADNMTSDAQQALRRTMEKYRTVRFILIANYSSKIISPIQSRCAIFRFRPIALDLVVKKIKQISIQEKFTVNDAAIAALYDVSAGDMRKLVNILQSACVLSNEITEEIVQDVAGRADPKEIRQMLEVLHTHAMDGFHDARKNMRELVFTIGISAKDLIFQINSAVLASTFFTDYQKVKIIEVIGEIDFRLTEGASEEIQLVYLLSKIVQIVTETKSK